MFKTKRQSSRVIFFWVVLNIYYTIQCSKPIKFELITTQSFFSDSAAAATFRKNETYFLFGGWERSEELNSLKCDPTWSFNVCLSLLMKTIWVFDGRIIERHGKTCRQVVLKADWVLFWEFLGKTRMCFCFALSILWKCSQQTNIYAIICAMFETSIIRSCVKTGHIVSTRWWVLTREVILSVLNLRCSYSKMNSDYQLKHSII